MERDILEQALERTNGNAVLAELLVKTVANFITPVDDPLYDWQIRRIGEIAEQVKQVTPDGLTWRAIPNEISCRQFKAPAKQCALAWGHRMVAGNPVPTPVAVLVWATKDENGGVRPILGTQFFVRNAVAEGQFGAGNVSTRWFTPDTSLDPRVTDALLYFLNTVLASGPAGHANNVVGIDLDE